MWFFFSLVFKLHSHLRLERGWGGRDQGPEEQVGGTISLRTHESLHGCQVDELSGEGKGLLFADNWQLSERPWAQHQMGAVSHTKGPTSKT